MPRSKEIPEHLRKTAVDAYRAGKGYKAISKALGLHRTTVRAILSKWRKFGTVVNLPRSGRPAKISAKAKCKIIQGVTNNPRTTSRDLQACATSSKGCVAPPQSCSTEPQPTASYHGDQDYTSESRVVDYPRDLDDSGEIPMFNIVVIENEEDLLDWSFGNTAGQSPISSCSDEETRVPVQKPKNHTAKTFHRCLECGKEFPHPSKLQRHMRTHTGEKPFPCSVCGKRFRDTGALKTHERLHTGEKPFACPEEGCGKRFVSQGKLKLHHQTHTGEKPCHCSVCGKSFARMCHLKVHLMTHAGEEQRPKKPFQCSECDRGCKSAAELKMHQRMHTGERPFQCATCKKTFVFPSSLTRHEQSHISEENSTAKPYSCSECGKEFTQPWTLKIHVRQHTGEKPYHCSQCEKRFSSSSLLKRHQRVHTGEKPFECSDCGKCFSSSANRSSHRRRIHDGNAVATSQQKHATNTVGVWHTRLT
ncbi:zinc finger protein 2-like isoform X2 [Esox lucius]|uniref:zinc finger protein 2-like isoform X2 n=1 Tax=Esox lucius TaxID=8010 RepID=UPI0014771EF8|nr:zinc finger protein 2-like isoform X2 [Esox lucius]